MTDRLALTTQEAAESLGVSERFCVYCGERLEREVRWTGRYEYTTGERSLLAMLVCPRVSRWRFWECHTAEWDTGPRRVSPRPLPISRPYIPPSRDTRQ